MLVVDDNEVNAMVISGYLRKLGIQPEVVNSGSAALARICRQGNDLDLVLMDCEMPEIDGYEATEQIRSWENLTGARRQPICALSAHVLENYRKKCFDAGMDDFLAKPIDFERLKSALRRHVRN